VSGAVTRWSDSVGVARRREHDRRRIIGATALGFYYDMHWRKTADGDLVVAVEIDESPVASPSDPDGTSIQTRSTSSSPHGVSVLPVNEAPSPDTSRR
jgi:hypothetical protein